MLGGRQWQFGSRGRGGMLLAPPEGDYTSFATCLLFSMWLKCPSLHPEDDPRSLRETERGVRLMTIVRYDPHSQPMNRYPREIISPPAPSPCCHAEMERMGRMERGEGGWPYFYRRCRACGYTVREFVGYAELAELVLRRGRRRREGVKGVAWRTWIARVFSE